MRNRKRAAAPGGKQNPAILLADAAYASASTFSAANVSGIQLYVKSHVLRNVRKCECGHACAFSIIGGCHTSVIAERFE